MRVLLQRVIEASVEADEELIGSIDRGLVTLLGVAAGDGRDDSGYLAEKILHIRIFDDDRGKLNHALLAIGGTCLVVSQFTLLADTRRGRRPDFLGAVLPAVAIALIDGVVARLRAARSGSRPSRPRIGVVEGRFGPRMIVRLANQGPVTILLDSRERA